MTAEAWLPFVIAGVFTVAGIVAVALSARGLRHRSAVASAPRVEEGAPASGYVSVEGTVEGAAEGRDLLASPLTGTPCVAYAFTVEEDRRARGGGPGGFGGSARGSGTHGSASRTIDQGKDAVPFHLDAGGHRVRVDPDTRIRWKRYERIPANDPRLAAYKDGESTMDVIGNVARMAMGRSRRYREAVLTPGATAFVAGHAERDGKEVRIRKGAGPFIIADEPRDALVKRLARNSFVGIAMGVVFVAVGVAIAVAFAGVA